MLASLAAVAIACSRPVQTARTTPLSQANPEVLPAEREAALRLQTKKRCSKNWGLLFPGLGQFCTGDDGKAAVLGGLAAAEIGAAASVAVAGDHEVDHPGVALPLVALQDLWIYGISDTYIAENLAAAQLYAPTDSLFDLAAAPFNWQVMKRPGVWLGTLVALAAGIGISLAVDENVDTDNIGDDPNVFGYHPDAVYGYPIGVGVGAGLFTHVGIAEEAFFRGVVQSSFARNMGETRGWIAGSAIFGIAHAPNALALSGEERANYLRFGVPAITVLGSYLGWLYKESDYSLAPPTAVHFWYDLLLSTTFFVLEPESSPISAGVRIPF